MFSKVHALTTNTSLIQGNNKIAYHLFRNFFSLPPPLSVSQDTEYTLQAPQLPIDPLTIKEIRRAIFAATPFKIPGLDGLLAIIWQKLWPKLQHLIYTLFCISIIQKKLSYQWKVMKVILFHKPNKDNYTLMKLYQLISLLSSLGKMLEVVVVECISFLIEMY